MPALLRRLNRPVVAILAVAAIAGALRFTHLGYPEKRIFDEYYYSKSACIFLGYSDERCDINSEDERYWRDDKNDTGAWVHPPLGKWTIALGELAFGTESFGWRVSGAVVGTASVVALALIVQLLFASALWTFVGGLLLATESLNFVQSRTAMLDIFVAFWIVLGFLLLLLDRRWIERRTPAAVVPVADVDGPEAAHAGSGAPASPSGAAGPPVSSSRRVPAPLWRPWRIAAGAALGAGFATKWSALTAVAAVFLLSFLWEVTRRRRAGVPGPIVDTLMAEGFGIVLALLVVPLIVYVVAYLPWFGHFGWSVGDWWRLQNDIFDYHRNLRTIDEATGEPVHAYLSEAWRWIFLWRPVLYYADYHEGFRQVIYANGNPAIFWASVLAVPYAAYAWAARRDWRAGFAFIAVAVLYVPWLLVPRPQFLFYATPISAFLVLAIVVGLRDLSEVRYEALRPAGGAVRAVRPYLPVVVGFVVVSVGLFVWFWPVLTGGPVSDEGWALRAWFPSWV